AAEGFAVPSLNGVDKGEQDRTGLLPIRSPRKLLPTNRRTLFPVKLTTDTLAKLKLPPGKTEHVVWDDDIAGFGIRLREHSATYFFRYRHDTRHPRLTIAPLPA